MTDTATPKQNDAPEARVIIFDTTMRDGEQSPGASMSLDEKIELAKILEEMGVDVIEAGFPIASNGDFEAVREIAKLRQEQRVCGLARAGVGDIDRAGEALQHAKRARIHTFLSTSPLHRKYQLLLDAEQVHERVIESVTHARQLLRRRRVVGEGRHAHRAGLPVPLRRERDQGRRHARSTSRTRWATPTPRNSPTLIRMLIRNNVPDIDKAVISVHCHNDLGPRRRQLPARRSRPGRGRSSARSTASASGPATARWRRS